ncbi:MAG: alpha/beta hydrolase, partial [Planctomycetota bacterium]
MHDVLGLVLLLAVAGVLLLTLLTALLVRTSRRPPRHTAGYALARGLPVDPGDLDLAFEPWTLDRADGAHLPVWEIDAAHMRELTPSGEPPAALTGVFVHGWGESRLDVLDRLSPWMGLFDRMVLYDLRGHGDAEGGLSRLGAGEEDDLAGVLDRLGPQPVVLVGYSMGAVIALNAAAHPGVQGVVAYGPYLGLDEAMRGRLREMGYPSWP